MQKAQEEYTNEQGLVGLNHLSGGKSAVEIGSPCDGLGRREVMARGTSEEVRSETEAERPRQRAMRGQVVEVYVGLLVP